MIESDLTAIIGSAEEENLEYKGTLPSRDECAEYAVGIGNFGGGRMLVGIDNKSKSPLGMKELALQEIHTLKQSVFQATGIRIEIQQFELSNGNVLVIEIPGRRPGELFYTKAGKYLIRDGESLRGMTPHEIDSIRLEGGREFSAAFVPGPMENLISPSGMEALRELMMEAHAEVDLIERTDRDLLEGLGLWRTDGGLTRAGLLLVGRSELIQQHVPYSGWQFFRMLSDTEYDITESGEDCLTIGLKRIRTLVEHNNPVTIVPGWLVHPEVPRYPRTALRELLVNAFVHRDYQVPGTLMLRLYPEKLELGNPGGFVGGVDLSNILHHPSVPRYPALMRALATMRLANRANLGLPRIYRDFLGEGKEPPIYSATPEYVVVTAIAQEPNADFHRFIRKHEGLDVDEIIILHHLTRHREIKSTEAARICQRPLAAVMEPLSKLASSRRLVEKCGSGRAQYYRLSRSSYDELFGVLNYRVDERLSAENSKARILSALQSGALSNSDLREITQLSPSGVRRLMNELREEGLVELIGEGRGATYVATNIIKDNAT